MRKKDAVVLLLEDRIQTELPYNKKQREHLQRGQHHTYMKINIKNTEVHTDA